jgi:DNA-binding MarR family transcriptional regulator
VTSRKHAEPDPVEPDPVEPDPAEPDPTEHSRWRPLRLLLGAMDLDIASLYDERSVAVRPRYVMPLVRLSHQGPMTIRQLADSVSVTHSAMSQTVAAMRRDGLVRSVAGRGDARTREVAATRKGRALVPFMEAEWRATEAALAELEEEIPYPLSQVVRDVEEALARRSFHDRIAAILEDEQ